jgi:chorismate synthase
VRVLTAGESHGRYLVTIIEGAPAGLFLTAAMINEDLAPRQKGFGRGGRQSIERDQVQILSGVRHGETLGSPIALLIPNLDWPNWEEAMSVSAPAGRPSHPVTRPRPGHADLPGAVKYGRTDIRDILERASARETAARCAAGAVAKTLLGQFGVDIVAYVEAIGGVRSDSAPGDPKALREARQASPVFCPDPTASGLMVEAISKASDSGDTLGGVLVVRAHGLPPGLGSHVHWDRRLDGLLAGALMALNGIKGVEVGLGFRMAELPGSQVHDPIGVSGHAPWRYSRPTNNAGGLEGGITNGEPLVLRAAMKPIATMRRPMASVDMATGQEVLAHHERSDVCAVPSAAVVSEAIVALVLAGAFQEKFGGDSLREMKRAHDSFLQDLALR